MTDPRAFRQRFGPWALVAGASRGLGAEFAAQLAERGLNLVLVAREEAALQALAADLRARFGVEARALALDVSASRSLDSMMDATDGLEIGLLVYNAAYSVIGGFLTTPLAEHLKELETNCRAPLAFAHRLGQAMLARGRGGILLMSSLSGAQGAPLIANYAATKAYNQVLAEGLWDELRASGIAVLSCNAGAISTPGYARSLRPGKYQQPGMPPAEVARAALNALGRQPGVTPGVGYRLSAFVLTRLLPRAAAVRLMGRVLRAMYGEEHDGRSTPT